MNIFILKKNIKKITQLTLFLIIVFLSIIGFSMTHHIIQAQRNSFQPVDAYLVLGGSITREIHGAQLIKNNPNIPIIISQGSKDPCILLIFQKIEAKMDNVWLEKCADSTFDNFLFSVPIMKKSGVKKVQVITSNTHFPRAKIMAKVSFISQGIAVKIDGVEEVDGIPANYENNIKTLLDVTRTILWSLVSQFYQFSCNEVIKLSDIDLESWNQTGFNCERRGNLVQKRQSSSSLD